MRKSAALLGLIAAIALGLAIVAFWRTRQPDVEITTAQVTSGPIARQVLATGTLEPVDAVDVGTQVSGTIQALEADFNSPVSAGQIVARLDPAPYRTQLEHARAELERARARAAELSTLLKDASIRRDRADSLASKELIAREELDTTAATEQEAAAELKASEATILAAEAAVKRAEVDLSHTIIRSPIDGVVVHRHVSVGQTVAARLESPVLFTIADLRRMQLVADIDEGEVGGVQPGTPVTFQIEALGEATFEGRIADVRLQPITQTVDGPSRAGSMGTSPAPVPAATSGSQSTPAVSGGATTSARSAAAAPAATPSDTQAPGIVSYQAVIEMNNEEGRLLPGGTAIVHLTSGTRHDVVRIPNAALSFAPSADVRAALGGENDAAGDDGPKTERPRDGARRTARVWRHEEGRLVPVEIEIGVSDVQWTEVVSGPVKPGEALVTSASMR